jgi:hypothetical protein
MNKVIRKCSHMQAGRAAACVTPPMMTVPGSPANENHWGHLICNFIEGVPEELAEEVAEKEDEV